jgi:hypothetical protein
MSELDPCLSFGFLIESEDQYRHFVEQIKNGIKLDQDFAIFYLKDDLSASITLSSVSLISLNSQFI